MRLSVTRIFLSLVVIATLAFLGVFIFAVDPETLNPLGQVSFFGLWFLLLTSGISLILIGLARRFLGEDRASGYQGSALRQGMLLACLLLLLMVAQYFRLLTWWGALLVVALLLLVELTCRRFQSLKR